MRVIVVQKGAREHYLVARALHREGMLEQLVTDWYAPSIPFLKGCCAFFGGNRLGQAALAARSDEIPDSRVSAFRLRSLIWKWREWTATRRGAAYDGFEQTDAAFARAVARIRPHSHTVFFGYSYASLEMLMAERRRGKFTILCQIDPGPAEFRLVAEEMRRHPELAGEPRPFPQSYYARVRQEWKLADLIVVNSEWSREALVAEGADAAKIEVLPLAYEADATSSGNFNQSFTRRLRLLWLGQVNVRKGIHYLIEAARRLETAAVEFVVAGPLRIRDEIIASSPKNIRWLGAVPRSAAEKLYRQSDLFVLPTLSDGFAITQLEALAHGLPVIATPNCGRVLEDGRTGFMVPPRDSEALAEAILRFVRDRDLIRQMRPSCLEAVKAYSIQSYGARLKGLMERRIPQSIS